MRSLGLISIGITIIGLAAYVLMGEASPQFVVPLILASGLSALIFTLLGLISKLAQGRRKYQCLNCGTIIRGRNPVQMGNVSPNCGGCAFK